jgi:hypothetical protein
VAGAAILGTTGTFISVVMWLHVVRTDVSPMARGISRYAVGPYGSAISLAFGVLAVAIAIAAWQLGSPTNAAGFPRHARSLWVAVAGLAILIVWPLRSSSAGVVEYWLHQVSGAAFFVAAAGGVQAIPRRLDRANGLRAVTLVARGCSVAAVVTVVLFFGSVIAAGTPLEAIRGALQRGCFAALSGSLVALGVGLLLDRAAGPTQGVDNFCWNSRVTRSSNESLSG